MPMTHEEYEALLSELVDTELTHERRIEILALLRSDYTNVIKEHQEHTNTIEELKTENLDLVKTNSKLFRQAGTPPEKKQDEVQKDFSETVTISQLTGGMV